jgi:hypothetical protein
VHHADGVQVVQARGSVQQCLVDANLQA